jgi:hypothetical protein
VRVTDNIIDLKAGILAQTTYENPPVLFILVRGRGRGSGRGRQDFTYRYLTYPSLVGDA